ncbi:MAG TPA: methyltransferase domain-containing protein [Methylomirabilota bacterium]|nr:methyltransferase domain-containing protein [Methylomirabilota bacterium]
MGDKRETLRATFDAVAERYHRARPEYPEALFDTLLRQTGLRAGDHVLEVGCATGKATRPLAERGLHLTCVELGAALAAVARRNLAGFDDVEIVHAAFETWRPPEGATYDAVVAATAWHWIDPGVRYRRAWELLRPGGHLAFWSAVHVFPDGGDRLFHELQAVYDEVGEARVWTWPRPRELPHERAEILATGLFDQVTVTQFDWQTVHDAESYIDLLETFSGHIAMQPWQRERLYSEIRRRLAERPDGLVRRHWGAALHVARRTDPA